MSGEFIEFFNELLYGSGSYLGLLIIICISLGIAAKIKFSSIVLIPFSALMIVFYWNNVAANSNFMWSIGLMFLNIVLIAVLEAKR